MRSQPGCRRACAPRPALVASLAGLALLAAACGGGASAAKSTTTTTASAATRASGTRVMSTTTSTTAVRRHFAPCPLTGAPPPSGGNPPRRAAVAVKVENLNQARPQWGLNHADIVFEEPVEGGVTRFIAVFQCEQAARIEPVRSARLVDAQVLAPLGKVLFAYSGAIGPVIDEIDSRSSLLEDLGAQDTGQAYWRDPARIAPHNLVTSTALLYAAAAAKGYAETPPKPYFSYGPAPAGGMPVTAVHVDYPLDITTWTWSASMHLWLRSYACPPGEQAECIPTDNGPATLGDGQQISAADVVVLHVRSYPTPYIEDDTGAHEDELTLTGSGPAWVFRNGEEFAGKWERPHLSAPATFVEADGREVRLAPGRTWEELVPYGDPVRVTGALAP